MNLFIQFLTYFRIIAAPSIFILMTVSNSFGLALILFFLASISDFWDGYLARKYNLESTLGEILDPIADKVLLVFLLFAISMLIESFIFNFISCFIVTREFWVSALRVINARSGNMNATSVTLIAKIKTSTQFIAILLFMSALYLQNSLIEFIAHFVLLLSLILSLKSALEYSVNSIKILEK
tara:strand:+ start:313 stop:858 length:546 start_codon:yes stop_codon:yes gene_type:complete